MPSDDYSGKPDADDLDDQLDRATELKATLEAIEGQLSRIDDGLDRIARKGQQLPQILEGALTSLEGLFDDD